MAVNGHAETSVQRTVGMATCSASQFDTISKLPYLVIAPLALVFDRRDAREGQVVGCLQANDVAVAADVQLPWIVLPKGSFVRFPQMKKARVKLQKEGWMMISHSDFGTLLQADRSEEVAKLFETGAFKKPPMVKVSPSEKKDEATEAEPSAPPAPPAAPEKPKELAPATSAPVLTPAVSALYAPERPKEFKTWETFEDFDEFDEFEKFKEIHASKESKDFKEFKEFKEFEKFKVFMEFREFQEFQKFQKFKKFQHFQAPERPLQPQPQPPLPRQPSRQLPQSRQPQQQQPQPQPQPQPQEPQQQQRRRQDEATPNFGPESAKSLLKELLEKYSTPGFVQRCRDLDKAWVRNPKTPVQSRLLGQQQLCDSVIRTLIPRYGFDASPTGCSRVRRAINELNRKAHPEIQDLYKQIQKLLHTHCPHMETPPEPGSPLPSPQRRPTTPNVASQRPPVQPAVRSGPEAERRSGTEVLFWGICDIKYNPALPAEDQVLVLELGDGRASRFSGHGSYIKEDFDKSYYVSDSPLKRSIMVDNKKITHDMFERAGYLHLRPRSAAYPRRYTVDLAARLVRDLGLREGHAAVLKLLNRARGAGVVVVTAETADATLRRLLTPPSGPKMQEWLEKRSPGAVKACYGFKDPLEECCLHWWSNECPVFLAERCCHSCLVPSETAKEELFDGTLRVAFALKQPSGVGGEAEAAYEVVWLGGYWKLPKVPSGGRISQTSTPEDLHDRIVSSFNSAEKRTAPVSSADLERVQKALTPALPRIFQIGGLQPEAVDRAYRDDPLFRAFVLARVSAAIRLSDMTRARALLDTAKGLVQTPTHFSVEELPERSVLSYVERNLGVGCAIEGRWEEAGVHWRRSVRMCSPNATAYYLEGCYYQVSGNFEQGVRFMQRSIALDPDFRSSYIGLSNCYLLNEDFALAIEACDSCLHRFPDALGAQFNLGQAVYQIRRGSSTVLEDAEEREAAAIRYYEAAKSQAPDFWTGDDAKVLEWLRCDNGLERARMPRQPVHVWRVFGWRP